MKCQSICRLAVSLAVVLNSVLAQRSAYNSYSSYYGNPAGAFAPSGSRSIRKSTRPAPTLLAIPLYLKSSSGRPHELVAPSSSRSPSSSMSYSGDSSRSSDYDASYSPHSSSGYSRGSSSRFASKPSVSAEEAIITAKIPYDPYDASDNENPNYEPPTPREPSYGYGKRVPSHSRNKQHSSSSSHADSGAYFTVKDATDSPKGSSSTYGSYSKPSSYQYGRKVASATVSTSYVTPGTNEEAEHECHHSHDHPIRSETTKSSDYKVFHSSKSEPEAEYTKISYAKPEPEPYHRKPSSYAKPEPEYTPKVIYEKIEPEIPSKSVDPDYGIIQLKQEAEPGYLKSSSSSYGPDTEYVAPRSKYSRPVEPESPKIPLYAKPENEYPRSSSYSKVDYDRPSYQSYKSSEYDRPSSYGKPAEPERPHTKYDSYERTKQEGYERVPSRTESYERGSGSYSKMRDYEGTSYHPSKPSSAYAERPTYSAGRDHRYDRGSSSGYSGKSDGDRPEYTKSSSSSYPSKSSTKTRPGLTPLSLLEADDVTSKLDLKIVHLPITMLKRLVHSGELALPSHK